MNDNPRKSRRWKGRSLASLRALSGAISVCLSAPAADAQQPWQWETLGEGGGPGARSYAVVAWARGELLVWGGLPFGINMPWLNDGWRYNPVTNAWRPMSTENAPAARQFPTGVWTGNELVIWGGHKPLNPPDSLRSGARYDPASDTWLPMSPTGSPSKRGDHTMTWTGTEVVVWGGYDFGTSTYLADGARYDPGADSWSPITTTDAPSARNSHSAVWTGSRLIIWGGGRLAGSWSNLHWEHAGAFGLYDPERNAWSPGSTEDAPLPRSDHSAIWTGTEMIVWGGWRGPNFQQELLANGSRFEPESGTWIALPDENAPTARTSHACAWSGREMIVWGGTAGNQELARAGGRFDPETSSWSLLPTENAPTGGKRGAAAWSGEAFHVLHDKLARAYETGPYALDGLPDDWQYEHFGRQLPEGGAGRDPDADHQDNTLEFLAGTIPTDPLSRLAVSLRQIQPSGELRLDFHPGRSDRRYHLEQSALCCPPTWQRITDAIAEAGPESWYFRLPPPQATKEFYRLVIEQD